MIYLYLRQCYIIEDDCYVHPQSAKSRDGERVKLSAYDSLIFELESISIIGMICILLL